jgi:hypothetical protein
MTFRQLLTVAVSGIFVTACLAGTAAKPSAPRNKEASRQAVAQTIEKVNSDRDLLRVHIAYARPVDGKLVCIVVARWGDLDKKIAKGGKEYYSNWDGSCTVNGGTVTVPRELAFEDKTGHEPTAGTGWDKITGKTDTSVTWKSGVVGATDGLVFKVSFDNADSTATLTAGKFTVEVKPIQKS